MYLSSVDITGFKSFAQKTPLRFSDGLTAIVGPNGCGKTNIVDAIRWALGEQKTSVLRSDAMENVIFNGTRTRRPVGLAEVSLTIQNNRQILPTEYTEVTITRRLFRNGESQYFLNKTQCRLKDIIDLFMDTGMGSDAYSVIELKMIEKILSDRTDERRHLFEEAAGVTKYKARRKETKRRIDSIKNDVSRVQDILREVQKNVYSLARQADKAKLHADLTKQLSFSQSWLLYAELKRIENILQSKNEEYTPLQEQLNSINLVLIEAEKSRISIDNIAESFESEMKELQDEFQNSSTAFAAMSQQKAVSHERIKAFSDAIFRASNQQKETELLLNQAEITCEQSRQKAQNLSSECSQYEKDIQVLKDAREAAKIYAQELYQQSTAFDAEISQIDSILSQHRSASDRTSERIAGLERRILETNSEHHQTLVSLDLLQKEISEKDTLTDGYVKAVLNAENIVSEKQHYLESLQNTITTIQQTLGDLQNEKGHHSASIEFLKNLIDTSESSVHLSSSISWNPKGGKITLAEIIDAEESLTIAIDAALGEAGKYFVVDNQEEALAGCAELHKHNKGKSSFICTSLIPTVKPLQNYPQADGIIGLASEIVQVDEHIRNILRILLAKTIIVENANIAMELATNNKDFSFITLKGEIFSASGIIRGGSTSSSEGKNIGKREQIAKLTKALNLINAHIIELQQKLEKSKIEFNSINIRALHDDVRKAEQEKNSFQQSVAKLMYKKDAVEVSLQKQKDALVDFQQHMQSLLQSNTDDKETIEHIIQKKNVLMESKQTMLIKYRIAETDLSKAEDLYRAAELIIVQKKAEERAANHEVNRLAELIKQKNDQLQFLENEQKRAHIELQALESSIFSVNKEITEEQERLQFLKEVIANRESKSLELKRNRNEAKEYEAKVRAEQHAIMQLIHSSELNLQQAQIEYKRIVEKVEEHSPGIDLVHIPEDWIPLPDFDEIIEREKSKKITQRLQSLGNVNFLALEEYEKEHERFEFLKSQLADLSEAEHSLQDTMTEINQTAQQRFHDTFEQIRVHFKHLFSVLFSGSGQADIHLGEGDPLECSIEISAKPPGKRPQSIELLSAGEKTLTAIALLFAIYLVKPSPFCILDEVDAPLDDANIDRYLQLIRSFSDKTQFLMITHNKKTMEAADTLYGITQEEEGVSKVVSVRFTRQDIAV